MVNRAALVVTQNNLVQVPSLLTLSNMIKDRIHGNSDKHLVSKVSPICRKLVSRLEDLELSQYLNGLLEVATGSLNEATMAKSTGVADMILSLIVTTQTFMCF